jgi:hypothetical protein
VPKLGAKRKLTNLPYSDDAGQGFFVNGTARRAVYKRAGTRALFCVCEMLARDAKDPDERRESWSLSVGGSRASYEDATGTSLSGRC